MVGEEFDEYDDLHIPMEKWQAFLEKWKRFYSFRTFDEAFEDACGIDYSNFTAKDEAALRRLSTMGDDIWENRQKNPTMLHALIEWTEKYSKDSKISKTYVGRALPFGGAGIGHRFFQRLQFGLHLLPEPRNQP